MAQPIDFIKSMAVRKNNHITSMERTCLSIYHILGDLPSSCVCVGIGLRDSTVIPSNSRSVLYTPIKYYI